MVSWLLSLSGVICTRKKGSFRFSLSVLFEEKFVTFINWTLVSRRLVSSVRMSCGSKLASSPLIRNVCGFRDFGV